ncbi:hypothetical protein AMAG_13396 [Allomyces macrogynus ATCC 38327]|uniref:Uncharacterized protein n=1 Tax=Allomyces macrogynus (strain ATCC 38327) TaxID=578462 RepID=A0A0L0T1X7_ALLM3|nr:hypothetical protein AMAG_13396 [Allomyces macrogynus ATCC 38327]|eukprot:KNE68756.1 hypothetical protein AMAG_13396 [Allomyces macrogynus ATCC 38327]
MSDGIILGNLEFSLWTTLTRIVVASFVTTVVYRLVFSSRPGYHVAARLSFFTPFGACWDLIGCCCARRRRGYNNDRHAAPLAVFLLVLALSGRFTDFAADFGLRAAQQARTVTMIWVGGDKHSANEQYAPPDRDLNLTRGVLDTALRHLVKDMPAGTSYLTRNIDEGAVMAMQLDPACGGLEGGASKLVEPVPLRNVVMEINVPEGVIATPVFSTSALFVATNLLDKGSAVGMFHFPIIIGMDGTLSRFVGVDGKGGPNNLMLVTSGGRAQGSDQEPLWNTVLGSRLNCQTPAYKDVQQWIEARSKNLEIAIFDTLDLDFTQERPGSIRYIMFLATTANGTIESLTVASYAPRSSLATISVDYSNTEVSTKRPVTRGWTFTEMPCEDTAPRSWSCKMELKRTPSTGTNSTSIGTSTVSFASKSAICFGSTTVYSHSNQAGFDNPDFVYAAMPANQTSGQNRARVVCANPTGKSSVPGGMHLSSWFSGKDWALPLKKVRGEEPIKVSTIAYRVALWELLTSLLVAILLLAAIWFGVDPASELCLRHLYSASVPGTCLEDRVPLERTMHLALIELPSNMQVGPFTHHVQLCPRPGLAKGVPQADSAMDLGLLGDETTARMSSRGRVVTTATTYLTMRAEVKRRGLEGRVGGLEL